MICFRVLTRPDQIAVSHQIHNDIVLISSHYSSTLNSDPPCILCCVVISQIWRDQRNNLLLSGRNKINPPWMSISARKPISYLGSLFQEWAVSICQESSFLILSREVPTCLLLFSCWTLVVTIFWSGNTAVLHCKYTHSFQDSLYSLKWYKDEVEFYRCSYSSFLLHFFTNMALVRWYFVTLEMWTLRRCSLCSNET